MDHASRRRRASRPRAGLPGLILAVAPLAGCVANSSNPVVRLESATMSADAADLELAIDNPGGRRLTVTGIGYELSHGSLGLPVAHGRWDGSLELPAGGAGRVALHVPFEDEPLEADSAHLLLAGTLHLVDHTGFLGLASMDLGESPFRVEGDATETDR